MANFYWDSFKTFFKIGAFTLGGGYAMIPMIEAEVVDRHRWIDREEFLDIIAIAQSCPGVFAINMSVFIGYKMKKTSGAVCSALFKDHPVVESIFRGIRPAVVALIAVPTFNMAKSAHITLSNCWIPIITALLIYLLHVNPVFIILGAGLAGYLYGQYLKSTES